MITNTSTRIYKNLRGGKCAEVISGLNLKTWFTTMWVSTFKILCTFFCLIIIKFSENIKERVFKPTEMKLQ